MPCVCVSLSAFAYLCQVDPSLPSRFDSWCFLEEQRSQECLSRGLKTKERLRSPHDGVRGAQRLFNRKASTWEGRKVREQMNAQVAEMLRLKIT